MLGHCMQASGELMKEGKGWSMGTVLLFNGRAFTSFLSEHRELLRSG